MIKYFLNGVEVHPQNRDEIKFSVRNRDNKRNLGIELSTDVLTFVNEDYELVKTWLDNNGYSVGMPLTIQFGTVVTQEYFLNFLDQSFERNGFRVNVKIERRNATNHFFRDADNLIFQRVNWNDSDFIDIDYQRMTQEQLIVYITLLLLFLTTSKALITSIQDIAEGVSDIQEASVPSVSAVGPVINTPLIISAVVKTLARAIKTTATLVSFIQISQQIIEVAVPPIRQFKGIKVKRLIEKSASFLGYNVQSDFLNEIEPLAILPVPVMNTEASLVKQIFAPQSLAFTKGYPWLKDKLQTLGAVISELEKIYNLQSQVENGTLILERESFFSAQNNVPVPLYYNDQEGKTENRSHNGEVYKRRLLTFQVDPNDIFTFDDALGLSAENGLNAIGAPAQDLDLITGFNDIRTTYARGSGREEFTFVEKFLLQVAKVIDLFTSGNASQLIKNRLGCLQISEQYFSETKLLWMQGSRISKDNTKKLNARYILDEYHEKTDFAETIESLPVPMTLEEFIFYSNQFFVTLENGEVARIISMNWDEQTQICEMVLWLEDGFKLNAELVKYD